MPKPLATAHSRCRTQIGRMWLALSMLAFLPSATAAVATQEPGLRRSERLDLRHLGKVSEDERAVLRIEWRAGLSGVEEIRKVDEMLEQLRRMDGTIAAIGLMVRNMPAQKPAAPMVTETATDDSGDHGLRLMVANVAAASLVALWWFRRRKSAKEAPFEAQPARSPVAALPRNEPHIRPTPGKTLPLADLPSEPVQGTATAPAPIGDLATGISEPAAAPVAPAVAMASATPAAEPPLAETPAAESAIMDFSLEIVEPEAIAENPESSPKPPPAKPLPAAAGAPIERSIEPTLQLAEIMLSMGLEQGAAQALIEYIEANPRHALYHWLKLLGIYRKRGLHKEFMETAEKLRLNFNIQAEDWAKPAAGEAPTLEKFSRVSEHIQKIWGQPAECIDYLQRLLADNRDGERAGFPQVVAEEMLLLIEILKEASGVSQSL